MKCTKFTADTLAQLLRNMAGSVEGDMAAMEVEADRDSKTGVWIGYVSYATSPVKPARVTA